MFTHYSPLLLLFFLVLCVPELSAQPPRDTGATSPMAIKRFQDAEMAVLQKDFRAAVRHLQFVVKEQPGLLSARRLMGRCHEQLGEYPEAAHQYLQIIKADSLFSRLLYYQLADAYYKMGEAHLALKYFERFQALQEIPSEVFGIHEISDQAQEFVLLDRLPNNIRACQLLADSVQFINITAIHNLGSAINTPYEDYFPFLTNDQTRLFYTQRKSDQDEDLLSSQYKNGNWRTAERVRQINTASPEGMSTLVRNGRRMYFTACLREGVNGPCDLWQADVDGVTLSQVVPVDGPVNSEHWESQAAISCDGEFLYFAANKPGGVGGTDLYVCRRGADGSWGAPRNLGEPINTPGDEEAPFISNDGKTLYFSSTGHLGMGEQDIFMTWWDTRLQRWSLPINLGPPVNGPHRELGFFLSADGRTGYFASNRPGGYGGMDIYWFELSDKLYGDPITYIEGVALDAVLRTPVANALVKIKSRDFPLTTDQNGRFFLCATAKELLDVEAKAEEYRPYVNQFDIPVWDNKAFYNIELLLTPKLSFIADIEEEEQQNSRQKRDNPREHVVTHTILFGFDKDELASEEIPRLDALVASLSDRNVVKLEIVGYSDDIGSDVYNLQLSETRAKNVAVFLLNRGVEVNGIHIEGKGSVDDDAPKFKNRRVDVRVVIVE